MNKEELAPLLDNFATTEYPIRASNLPNFLMCPGWLVAKMFVEREDTVWKATHTGTGFGIAANVYHLRDMDKGEISKDHFNQIVDFVTRLSKDGGELDLANGRKDEIDPFPLADLDQIRKWLDCYTRDPRNWQSSEFGPVIKESIELSVGVTLPPHPLDKTKLPIFITGHTDQVRRDPRDGCLVLWDHKCSKKFKDHIDDLILHYLPQQAVYVRGVWEHFKEPVRWGGIIHPPSYETQKRVPNPGTDPKKKGKTVLVKREPHESNVFIKAYVGHKAIQSQLDHIALQVALVRNTQVAIRSGTHCKWCVYEGFQNCHTTFPV